MDKIIFIHYILPFVSALTLSALATILIRRYALAKNIVDLPGGERKIHHHPVPLLGGLAIYASLLVLIFVFQDYILDGRIKPAHLWSIVIGGGWLMLGGFLDDKYHLKPSQSFVFPVLAALTVIWGGIEVHYITNPGGGIINISSWIVSALIILFWLLGMIYTTKLLDGLDGLVSGIGVIASVILFSVSLFWDINESGTSILCLLLAGAALGFWIFNFYPAKIFLGEGGSTFIGFMLGTLAIISGAKIATTLLIMGIPILDVAWTIWRRALGGQNPFRMADKKHLHFLLLEAGLNQRQAVLLLYILSLLFGAIAVFQETSGKLIALAVLALVTFTLVARLVKKTKKA